MTDELRRDYGRNIRAGRVGLGMRQEDLAQILRVRQSTVCRWESGDVVPRDAMKVRLAQVLHQDVRQLFPLTRSAA